MCEVLGWKRERFIITIWFVQGTVSVKSMRNSGLIDLSHQRVSQTGRNFSSCKALTAAIVAIVHTYILDYDEMVEIFASQAGPNWEKKKKEITQNEGGGNLFG